MLEVEERNINKIYQKGNDKIVEEKINELEKIKENKIDNQEEKIEKIKKELLELENSTNVYKIISYQKYKSKIEKLLKNLETHSTQIDNSQKPSLFRKEIIIPLSLGVIILLVVGLIVIRKRRLKRKIK